MAGLIGILHGTEGPFPSDLIDMINEKNVEGVRAEMIRIGEVEAAEDCPYDLIIDRISHCLPFFREYTRNAFLNGTYVINNPFRFFLEKFFAYSVAKKIGVKVPKTILLPTRSYPEGFTDSDLENMKFPLFWKDIIDKIGKFPMVLKPSEGGGWRDVYIVENMDELMDAYEESGNKVMLLQEFVSYEHFVRVLVFGKKHVMPIRYNPMHKYYPSEPAYIVDHHHLSPELGKIIMEQSIELCRVLDYDMNSVEFAIKDGIPYAIDFCNQVPDSRPDVVTPHYYEWILEKMSDTAIEYALNPPPISSWQSITPLIRDEMKKRQERKLKVAESKD